MTSALRRFLNVDRDELGPTLAAMGYFFFILFGYFLIRPVREALGVERSWSDLQWLFAATAVVMLPASALYGLLVSRLRRGVLVPVVYGFFLLNLLGFFALRELAPAAIGLATGYTFYVWLSVFSLFSTSIFWQVMADSFTLEQSKRIFPMVAVGGTAGAWLGSLFAWQLADEIGAVTLMPVAAGVIALGVGFGMLLMHLAPSRTTRRSASGGVAWKAALRGLSLVGRSRYLQGVAGYIFALAIASTFLYFAQAQIVTLVVEDTDERASIFGMIDTLTQATTLLLQLFVVGRLMRRLGVGLMLTILPVLSVVLVGAVAIWPTLLAITLAQAAFRAGKYAVARPSRETLFTVLTREEKYEAKAVMDTFVYRTGDLTGAGANAVLTGVARAMSLPAMGGLLFVAGVTAPLGVVWCLLGLWLGRRQRALAGDDVSSGRSDATPQPG